VEVPSLSPDVGEKHGGVLFLPLFRERSSGGQELQQLRSSVFTNGEERVEWD